MTTAIIDNIKREVEGLAQEHQDEELKAEDLLGDLCQIAENTADLYQYDNNDLIEMIETATEALKRRIS